MSQPLLTVQELVEDEYFRKWVQRELPLEDTFWDSWMAESPEHRERVQQARFIIMTLRMKHASVSKQRVSENVQRILRVLDQEENKSLWFNRSFMFKVAASVLLAAVLTGYLIQKQPLSTRKEAAAVMQSTSELIEKINNSISTQTIILSDGTSIKLQPGSRLTYPQEFASHLREVSLIGEAFFDVARDADRPFQVYTNEIVTKVLGTSFHIKAHEGARDIVVEVVTGKVSVMAAATLTEKKRISSNEGLILSANQMVVYNRTPKKLTRSLVEHPEIVRNSTVNSSDFNFENTPVTEVFKALEKGYGVPIVYDSEQLTHCTITAPLENENLYEKLDLICKVIRASYEIVDVQIVITSKGCQ